jgi:hypothetical protein
MDMNKEQWINGKKGVEKMIEYVKEIGLYNEIQERGKKTIARRKRINQDSDENDKRRRCP